ncbi:MAG: hypothetical protein KAX84_05725 [Burkholderiales bacterium]|nr:hypothetical protein [Burkholderiales bacterium]
MSMISRSLWIATLLLCLPTMTAAAYACSFKGQPVVTAVKKKVGVFLPSGKWVKDLDSSEIAADARVLDCNEDLGIVKIRIGGSEQWVDRLALNIRPAGMQECISRPVSRAADLTEPVTSGVGESCVPKGAK